MLSATGCERMASRAHFIISQYKNRMHSTASFVFYIYKQMK